MDGYTLMHVYLTSSSFSWALANTQGLMLMNQLTYEHGTLTYAHVHTIGSPFPREEEVSALVCIHTKGADLADLFHELKVSQRCVHELALVCVSCLYVGIHPSACVLVSMSCLCVSW
jgi:hypothetical protein